MKYQQIGLNHLEPHAFTMVGEHDYEPIPIRKQRRTQQRTGQDR